MRLNEFFDEVYHATAKDGPYFSLSMDLRPNADGRSPAQTILRAAWADVGEGTNDIDRMFGGTVEQVRDILENAVREGTEGIFLVASAKAPTQPQMLDVPVPGRNDLRVSERPWLVELERLGYFTKRPVVSVFVNREGVHVMRVALGEIETMAESERSAHALRKVHGRTHAENIVGGPGDFGGGHAWNKVENIVEEHRAAAAREGAALVAGAVQEHDILVIGGPEEPRYELIHELPDRLRNHVEEHEGDFGTERERLEWSSELAHRTQIRAADQVAEEVVSGARGELIARGREYVEFMLDKGRVGQLIIHQDAVSHWGHARDARRIEAPWDDAWYGEAIWKAHETSADVLFCEHPRVIEEHEGVVATLRW